MWLSFYHPGRPQCGQGLWTARRHATPPWAVISRRQCRAMTVVGVSNCQFALEAPLYQFYTWPGITIDQDYSVE